MANRVVIMGAAGRDFHNFNVYYRDNPCYEVVAFTATQIPGISGRRYPAALAGARTLEEQQDQVLSHGQDGIAVTLQEDRFVGHEDIRRGADPLGLDPLDRGGAVRAPHPEAEEL